MKKINVEPQKETATMTIRKISLTTSLALLIVLAGVAGAQAVGTEDIS